jgi:NAD(P)-dependent dehydrogenase (short-subunit alcohol dehydrogenase family)
MATDRAAESHSTDKRLVLQWKHRTQSVGAECIDLTSTNNIDLTGRTAIVTGAARGIGLAIAERILRSGGQVSLWDRDRIELQRAHASLRCLGAVHDQALELTDVGQIGTAVQAVKERFGAIDILVNNAGITGGNAPTWDLEPDVWRQVLEVNLTAPYLVCRAVVPRMLDKGYGRIVNVASIAGKEGNPNAAHYSASKAGLIALTKSLGKELATKSVTVNCVTPAAARTGIFTQMRQEHIDYMLSKIPMNRFVEPEEIAALVVWLASEECSFSTGAVFDISGGRATY